MGQEGDDRLSLPIPPPPNPAARRAAIETALRKYDGIEQPARPRRSLLGWASTHRGLAGGLVTATLIAVISIPAIQVAMRDHPAEVASEDRLPEVRNEPVADGAPDSAVQQAPQAAAGQVAATEPAVAANQPAPAPAAADTRGVLDTEPRDEKAAVIAPAPVVMRAVPPPIVAAVPPPPPRPPPPPEPAAHASDAGNIVVTGSRIRGPNLESASPVTVVSAQEIAEPFATFLGRLRDAISDNDRETVAKLVALPFHVRIGGERRTYSSSRAIYNDYELIFTPAVRIELLNLGPGDLTTRDGGRLRGRSRIWFGCGKRTCPSEQAIRIREVRP